MSETAERTKKIIADYLDIDPVELKDETSFSEDLDLDSLAKMELIIAFEEAFSIDVPDDTLDTILTVQDAIGAIETARSDISSVAT
ncbi:acyl carrier protein [Aliirhizobium terrae]|uniref:acyl carrier protein n=1 Tax=Terrirhizobium terrae TaxID=2926709 RepID=UPI0025791502|nr:acyl carrier protein [Rhizobium sp. CC-CFT758]WJH40037.1 acyl carrier protein [Rhizobium sp. CC-CFT758]